MSVMAMPPPKPTSSRKKICGDTKLDTSRRWKMFPGMIRPSGM